MAIAVWSRHRWIGVLMSLLAFPVLLASLLLRLAGRWKRALVLSRWVREEWLGDVRDLPEASAWREWAALPLALPVFLITLYLLTGIVINVAYPLRPESGPSDWGGPSLWGRWAVHAAGGTGFAILTPLICAGLRTLARHALIIASRPAQTKA